MMDSEEEDDNYDVGSEDTTKELVVINGQKIYQTKKEYKKQKKFDDNDNLILNFHQNKCNELIQKLENERNRRKKAKHLLAEFGDESTDSDWMLNVYE